VNFQEYIENLFWRIKDFQAMNPWLLEMALVAMALVVVLIGLLIKRRKRSVDVEAQDVEAQPPRPGRGKYEFRLCVIGAKHRWIRTRGDKLSFTFEDPLKSENPMDVLLGEESTGYEIDPRVLYEVDPSTIQKISWALKGISSVFIVVFRKGQAQPVQYQSPKRSAYVLKTVEESNALSNALKKEFAQDFNLKTFFMYLVLLIVAVVAYLFLTGKITI
jgi:hypothetical protein